MGNITGILHAVSYDWFILGGIAVILALDSLRAGVGRPAAISIALPLAVFFDAMIKKTVLIGTITVLFATPLTEAATLAVLFVLTYILVRRIGLDYMDGGMGEPIQAILACASVGVILIVVWLETPLLSGIYHLNPLLSSVFAENFRLWWLFGAYGALAFARG